MMRDVIPYGWLIVLVAGQLIASMLMNDGQFFYALDDAYIHLGLAEHIAAGHYGLQAGEFSSPSSSIIWPFLLAPFSALPFFLFVPFLINLMAAFLSVALLQSFFRLHFEDLIEKHPTAYLLAICSMIVGLNLSGLCMIGMEHGLQLLCAIFLITNILRYQMSGEVSRWLWVVIFIAPLIRYECLAISGITLLWLMFNIRYWHNVFIGGMIITALICFSLFLFWLGLPTMSLSILVKREAISLLPGGALLLNIMQPAAWVMLGALGLLLYKARGNPVFTFKILYIGAAMIIATHLLFGMVSVRYDGYVWGFVLPLLIFAYRDVIRAFMANTRAWLMHLRIVVALAGLMAPYSAYSLYEAPLASHNIAALHGNMHHFIVQHYQQPIAVNDVGRVSYNNPHYILDVVGLSNLKAYELGTAHMGNPNRAWMDLLLGIHQIDAAILFDSWFKAHLPEDWVKVAELQLGCCNVVLPEDRVSFYATNDAAAESLRTALKAFEPHIQFGATLAFK